MATKFYLCTKCGNVVFMAADSGVTPECCGSEMVELEPNLVDGVGEKHLPVLKWIDDFRLLVEVGELPHPQTSEHHIRFIYVETGRGGMFKWLDTASRAVAEFYTIDKVTAVYDFCNIHGLWKVDVNDSDRLSAPAHGSRCGTGNRNDGSCGSGDSCDRKDPSCGTNGTGNRNDNSCGTAQKCAGSPWLRLCATFCDSPKDADTKGCDPANTGSGNAGVRGCDPANTGSGNADNKGDSCKTTGMGDKPEFVKGFCWKKVVGCFSR